MQIDVEEIKRLDLSRKVDCNRNTTLRTENLIVQNSEKMPVSSFFMTFANMSRRKDRYSARNVQVLLKENGLSTR